MSFASSKVDLRPSKKPSDTMVTRRIVSNEYVFAAMRMSLEEYFVDDEARLLNP